MAENTDKDKKAENDSKYSGLYYVSSEYDYKMFTEIQEIIDTPGNKCNYVRVIKAKKYLFNWIMGKTKDINEKSSLKTRIYMILHNMNEIPKCKTCGRDFNVDIVNRTSGFSVFCGPACANRNKDIRQKIANTNT